MSHLVETLRILILISVAWQGWRHASALLPSRVCSSTPSTTALGTERKFHVVFPLSACFTSPLDRKNDQSLVNYEKALSLSLALAHHCLLFVLLETLLPSSLSIAPKITSLFLLDCVIPAQSPGRGWIFNSAFSTNRNDWKILSYSKYRINYRNVMNLRNRI